MADWPLVPPELWTHPQMAVLAVLDAALEVASCALYAEHRELDDTDRPDWIEPWPPSTGLAGSLLRHMDMLQRAIEEYREQCRDEARVAEIEARTGICDDIPF